MKLFINDLIALNQEWAPDSEQEFEENILEFLETLKCFVFFNEVEVFYDSSALQRLIDNFELVRQGNTFFTFDIVAQLREFISEIGAFDWRENKKQVDTSNYLALLSFGHSPQNINDSSIAEATEYSYKQNECLLISFKSSEFIYNNVVFVNRVVTHPTLDMKTHRITSVSSIESAVSVYLQRREQLVYNHNPKHGENHNLVKKKGGEIISPLECTVEEAKSFLKFTVGYRRTNSRKELYAYDAGRNKFIVFKFEGVQNEKKYHAFYPHDQKVPAEVKTFLVANKNLFI